MNQYETEWQHDLRQVFDAIVRRRKVVAVSFLVVAAALLTVYLFLTPQKAMCLMAVKRPSELFVPLGQQGIAASASVPLLEGQTYKDLVGSVGFAADVANSLKGQGLNLDPVSVHTRIGADFRDPDLLRLMGRDNSSSQAVLLANAACKTLDETNRRQLRAELKEQVTAMSQLLAEAHGDVQRNLAALGSYAKEHGLVNLNWDSDSTQLYRTLELMGNQQLALAQQQSYLEQDLHNLKVLKDYNHSQVSALDFPVQDPAIATYRQQIEQARKDLWDAKKIYTDNHPVVKGLSFEVDELNSELAAQLRTLENHKTFQPSAEWKLAIAQVAANTQEKIVGERAQVAAWGNLIDEQRRALGVVPQEAAEVNKLKVDLNFAQDRYNELAKKLDEAKVSLNSAQGSLSIIQLANSAEPPNLLLEILVSVGLLLGLPIVMGLFVDYMADSVHSPVRFATDLGETCLGAVPTSRYLTSRHLRNDANVSQPCLEQFRVMRSGLGLAWGFSRPCGIGVVSGHSGEGRSTVVLQLARALAENHKRVAILDADFRSEGVAPKLGVKNEKSLLQVFTGDSTLKDALITIAGGVELLPAKADGEAVPTNAELLFEGPKFRSYLDELRSRADVVLVDIPALLDYPDGAEMLRHLDAVVLVVAGDNREKANETAQSCLALLHHVDAKRLGIVVNHVNA